MSEHMYGGSVCQSSWKKRRVSVCMVVTVIGSRMREWTQTNCYKLFLFM